MYGVVLHAHPVRGESHNQRNTTGEVATVAQLQNKARIERFPLLWMAWSSPLI